MPDRSWMSFVMPFGKYKGDTLGTIRTNDAQYLLWRSENVSHGKVRKQREKAIAYLNEVDPWSLPQKKP
jgi:hypothetical protein